MIAQNIHINQTLELIYASVVCCIKVTVGVYLMAQQHLSAVYLWLQIPAGLACALLYFASTCPAWLLGATCGLPFAYALAMAIAQGGYFYRCARV